MKPRVLETRIRRGLKWRRYLGPDDVRFTTVEIPAEVLGVLGAARLAEELARHERRLARLRRNAVALRLKADGLSTAVVAEKVGLCEAQVRRLTAGARKKQPRNTERKPSWINL